jgi:hypothetical protein
MVRSMARKGFLVLLDQCQDDSACSTQTSWRVICRWSVRGSRVRSAARGLIVGCAAYEDPDIAPLRYAHDDAARVAEVLRTSCGVNESHLVVLHDDMRKVTDLTAPTYCGT